MLKSDFQDILKEDCREYNKIAKRYLELQQTNSSEAFEIMKASWTLAQRWSELQATARKIKDLNESDFNLTDFKKYCYERYRQMQLIHESTRVIWRIANEEEVFLRRQDIKRSELN